VMLLQCNSLLTVCQAKKTFTYTGNQSVRIREKYCLKRFSTHYNSTIL